MLKHVCLSVAMLSMAALTAVAQNAPGTPGQPGQPGQGAAPRGAQAGALDQDIATMLALGNQEEVALAQFAESRAQHPQVKEFAQMMQRDHTQALQRLQTIAPQAAAIRLDARAGANAQALTPGQPNQTVQAGQAGERPQQGAQPAGGAQPGQRTGVQQAGATAAVAGQAGDAQKLALHKAIAEQCLALTQRALEEAGDDFDKAYIGQQCVMHTAMLAKLQASEQFASGELRSFIQEAKQTVENHLQHAKQLKDELKSSAGAGAAAQRTGTPALR